MAKQPKIDYRKELELVARADKIAGLVNKTIGKLSYRNASSFLSIIKKNSVHLRRIEGLNDRAYVLNGLRERVPRLNLKLGELVSVKDLAELLNYNPNSTLNALSKLEDELDINLVGESLYPNNPKYIYALRPASEENYAGRIPIVGKPKLNSNRLIEVGLISVEDSLKLGVSPVKCVGGDFFNDFGLNPKVVQECYRQLVANVRKYGWTWGTGGTTSPYHRTSPHINHEESDKIFNGFIDKTHLLVGIFEGEPVLVYHPRLIRRYRKN